MSRRPEQNRWSAERLSDIKAAPRSTRERAEVAVRSGQLGGAQAPTEAAPPAAPRRFRINPSDLAAHGYIDGFPQCYHIERLGKPRPRGQHSNARRALVIEAIGGTDVGDARFAYHAERLDGAMVEFPPQPTSREMSLAHQQEISRMHVRWGLTTRWRERRAFAREVGPR